MGRKWLDSGAEAGGPEARCSIAETWQESHKLPISLQKTLVTGSLWLSLGRKRGSADG